jgi:hypothetical protein
VNTRVREINSPDGQFIFRIELEESGHWKFGLVVFPWDGHTDILLVACYGSAEEAIQHYVTMLENDPVPIAILREHGRAIDVWIEESPQTQLWPEEVDGVTLELRYWSGKPYVPPPIR